jgi:hypothetical protein
MLPSKAHVLFSKICADFIAFSERFIEMLQPAKPLLTELIREFCVKRDRQNSALLMWSECGAGEERATFNNRITAYDTLCNFTADLVYFLNDLLYSCPKAWEDYRRVSAIHAHVGALLKENNMSLKKETYKNLVATINQQCASYEDITKENVNYLMKAYMAQYRYMKYE